MFCAGRDKEGCRVLVICVRKHVKDEETSEDDKKHLVWLLEKLDKEEHGKKISILFDSEGAGLRFVLSSSRYQTKLGLNYAKHITTLD